METNREKMPGHRYPIKIKKNVLTRAVHQILEVLHSLPLEWFKPETDQLSGWHQMDSLFGIGVRKDDLTSPTLDLCDSWTITSSNW